MSDQRVALVIGGGQGIGKAIAERFAREGDRVVVADLPSGQAGAVAAAVGARALDVDVTDEASVIALFDNVMANEGRIDVVANAAGILRLGTNLVDVSLADWKAVLDVNLTGSFLCTREGARRMRPHSDGSIVIISSGAATIANQNQVAYNSSKAGLAHFVRSAAIDLCETGIRVNAVAPGPIESPMTRAFTPERLAYMAAGVPVGRLGRPEEVASAAYFLASPEAGYISGEILAVDGALTVAGRLARNLPK